MKRKKEGYKQVPELEMDLAEEILGNVFRECGRRPNSVPMEALSAYTVYRKERFGLQRGLLISMLILFFLLPFLFIDSRFTIDVQAAGERRLPVYVVDVQSPLPVYRVTAKVKGMRLPVYEAAAKTFTIEPTRNGEMTVDVALVNRQNTSATVEVTDVDHRGPVLVSSRVAGGEVRLFVEDEGTGPHLKKAYGQTAGGEIVSPLRTDEAKGMVVFAYPEGDLDVFIPDHIGNVLHLAMKHSR